MISCAPRMVSDGFGVLCCPHKRPGTPAVDAASACGKRRRSEEGARGMSVRAGVRGAVTEPHKSSKNRNFWDFSRILIFQDS